MCVLEPAVDFVLLCWYKAWKMLENSKAAMKIIIIIMIPVILFCIEIFKSLRIKRSGT